MKGFDNKFKDLPDYIIGITKEIWEDRDIASLQRYYAESIPLRSPAGIIVGRERVVAATLATLAELPDRQLYGEDVIWSGNADDGFLSSHRIISTATHNRSGVYGPASGAQLRYRILADCFARNNEVADEWLIRDQGAIVRQLGMQPQDYARQLIEAEGGADSCAQPYRPEDDVAGPYQGHGNDNEWGQLLSSILQRINNNDLAAIPECYDRAANLHYPGGVFALSHSGADQFWLGLRASFPKAQFSIQHCIGRCDDMLAPRAAVRWSLDGEHSGWGSFGAPSGARVHIMGITQAEFGPYGNAPGSIRREYTLFDEVAVWKQILLS